jgi:hypothetical protein
MTLKSALEDLTRSTLRAISGCLQRLEYLSGLRERGEGYSHWGFEKLHGESAANKALAEAHSSAVSNVLSTPLSKLLSDVQSSTQAEGQNTEAYLRGLSQKGSELLPNNPGPGSARHLSSVLHALLGLEKNRRKAATRQVS